MAKKYHKNKTADSPETIATAQKISKQVKTSAQTKAQTKLIEQGIRKGITLYKKQQKDKARNLNKRLKKAQQNQSETIIEVPKKSSCGLSWTLLIFTWIGISIYIGLNINLFG